MESLRYTIWKSNSDYVKEHNKAGKRSYTLGMNQFGDLTGEEFAEMNGYVMRPQTDYTHNTFKASSDNVSIVYRDWRENGAVTPVKNQGQYRSACVFGATGAMEAQHFLSTGNLISLSERNLVDCANHWNHTSRNQDFYFEYVIKNGGIDADGSYPYKGCTKKCCFRKEDIGATITNYTDIDSGDVLALTRAVWSIAPVAAAMDASHRSFQLYRDGVYSDANCSSVKLDHCVLIVGFGTTDDGLDYFLVKNSWGERWGMEGYFMIERSYKNMCGLATQASYPL